MRIQKLNEWNNQDDMNTALIVKTIQQKYPSFGVSYNNFNGSVYLDNKIIFSTNGPDSPIVINSFVSGYFRCMQQH